jgi:exosortase A
VPAESRVPQVTAVPLPASSPSISWPATYLALGCSLAVLVALYWRTAAATVALWTEGRYSHGFLVVPIALAVAWSRRDRFESVPPAPTLLALPLLALLSFGWLMGHLTATGVVQHICLMAMIVVFTWGAIGTAAARALVFPLGFLFFAIPIGDRLIPLLQEFTAAFAVRMVRLTGVPALLEGHVISTSGGSWEVAQACSGISYLFASLAICYIYAGLAYRRWSHRASLFVLSGVVPLLANGLRVYTIVLIASYGGTRIAEGIEHYLYGWLFFAIVVGLTLAIAGRWDEDAEVTAAPMRPATAVRPSRAIAPQRSAASVSAPALFAAVALVVVGAAPLAAMMLRTSIDAAAPLSVAAPVVSPPWRTIGRDAYPWRPRFVAPAAESLQSYESGKHAVQLYVASYRAGDPGAKLASAGNAIFDERWRPVGERTVAVTIDGRAVRAHETRLRAREAALVVWSWYAVDGTFTGNDYLAKVLLAKAALSGSQRGPAAFAIATADFVEQADAAAILTDFLGHLSLDGRRRAAE